MKRILKNVLIVSLLLLCVLVTTSCGSKLNQPDGFKLNEQTLTLSWNKVSGAMSYAIQISGEERERVTRQNTLSLEKLEPGAYEIKIKAIGDNVDSKDSKWSTYSFIREKESGLKYQLINGNTEYQVVGGGIATGDVVVDDYYRGKPVTSIADKAFNNNSRITSITVGKNVKTIGDKAFSKCTSLVSVVIPENVTKIGNNAFQSSKALVSVTLPDSITVINPYMFSWCSSLQSVRIGSKVTSIGDYAFSNCKTIPEIILPDTVVSIGQYAFSDCEAMTSLTLGTSLVQIADYGFANCLALENLTLPETLETVADYAFKGCEALKSVSIPDSVTTIGTEAFNGCLALSQISLGSGVKKIGGGAFASTAYYEAQGDLVCIDGWFIEVKNKGINTLALPAGIFGIADYACFGCEGIEQLKFSGIKYVGDYAFYHAAALWECLFDDSLLTVGYGSFAYCEYLRDMDLGESLRSIDGYAFYGCSKLAKLELPDSLESIGGSAFKETMFTKQTPVNSLVYVDNWLVGNTVGQNQAIIGDIKIKDGTRGISSYALYQTIISGTMYIPDGVEYIGRSAFYNSAYLTAIRLPETLKKIDDYAFYQCIRAQFGENAALIIPPSVEYIGRSAFYSCIGILSLEIPSSVKTIGDYAFYKCINIGNKVEATETNPEVTGHISIANGVEYIGNRAFQGCTAITSVVIPESVTYLGSHLFYKCSALQSVSVSGSLDTIREYTFFNCTALENVTLPDTVKVVEKYAFRGCSLLRSVALPAVETLGDYAFYKCSSIEHFTIPATLKHIGNYALRNCSGVESLIVPSTVETVGKHAFHGMKNATLYCETETAPVGWNERFNSSYRPIFWGCELSADKDYVVSVTMAEGNPDNAESEGGIADPYRVGYTFSGWATDPEATVVYTSENVTTAPSNQKLIAVWTQTNE